MSRQRQAQHAALKSSQQATTRLRARGEPKIGSEEFLAIARRFGYSAQTLDRIRKAILEEDPGQGPFLANYYCGLKESCVQAFERTARRVFGVDHAIGVSSGTGALHAAFVACGVGPGTEVICSAIGFMATASAVAMAGGTPVFCDVDESLHMDPARIAPLVTPRTVALAPTHVMGGVCDMAGIMRVARKVGLRVVEDCAQSCGGSFHGRYVGTIGDAGCFSISAYKVVGCGEGGLVLLRNKRLWERASQLAECGGLWRPERFAPPRYEGELFPGTNYRMSELEAAADTVQLAKMPQVVRRFRSVKRRILARLDTFAGITPQLINDPEGEVGYTLRFYPETVALAEKVVAKLQAEGVPAATRGRNAPPDWHSYAYMYPLMERFDFRRGDCPVADDLFDRVVTIQLNQWYTAADCRDTAARINRALGQVCPRDSRGMPWLRARSKTPVPA